MVKLVADYINKQKLPQKEICLALREILLKTYPGLKEEMKWGVPVYGGGKFYFGVVRYGVNLGFAINGLNQKEIDLFSGKGKTMRHIKIESLDQVDRPKLVKLIKLVYTKGKCP